MGTEENFHVHTHQHLKAHLFISLLFFRAVFMYSSLPTLRRAAVPLTLPAVILRVGLAFPVYGFSLVSLHTTVFFHYFLCPGYSVCSSYSICRFAAVVVANVQLFCLSLVASSCIINANKQPYYRMTDYCSQPDGLFRKL